ncbi:MAG: hypothetical protein VB086_09350 [Clostridiaceae bacterium]|nr:hypothetical protein [Clostridiaceae bacterium]
MRDLFIALMGTYTPVLDAAGNNVYGVAGVDWPWVFGALAFLVVLWSFFALLGAALKR